MIQINLTGFLNGKNAREFMGELWDLLISAQNSPDGIPPKLVELKKQELLKREEEQRVEQERLRKENQNFINSNLDRETKDNEELR